MVWYLSKHVCGVPNAWQKGWMEAFPGLGGERKTAMCKEQCVILRNEGERLGIRILVLDQELFLVIMELRTKHPGLGSFHYSQPHPITPGLWSCFFEILTFFVKVIFCLMAVRCTHPKWLPNEGKTQQKVCLSWKNKVTKVICPVVEKMQIKY